ncbi:extracellular solute-binding protein, partial [Rhizobium pusense]|uniref:extracellular solute-binding protein n=1 Tax=Agrobacterium pusense TaxID=648995 RepID=UPI00244930AC
AGISKDKIYPIDLTKAYKQLDKIKDKVVTFWDSGAQSIQLVADGSACLGTAWTSRVTAASKANQPVGRVWDEAIYHQDFFTVMAGAKNPKAAMQFLAYSLRPEVRAGISSDLGWIVSDEKIQKMMDPNSLQYQPTPDQFLKGMISDNGWWAKNLMDAYGRYSSWLTL